MRVVSEIANFLLAALHVVSDHNSLGRTLMAWRDVVVLSERCDGQAVVEGAARVKVAGWFYWILSSRPR